MPRDGRKPALERDFSPIANPPAVLTTRELCAKLGSLGYEDADTPQAETFVDTVGYQHAKQYLPDSRGGTLRKAHSLMVFDLEFQGVLLKYIGYFEIAFRARYSREMAERRGPFAHRNPKNFSDSRHFDEFLDRYGAELSRAVRRDGEARSNVEEYGDLPIWAASSVLHISAGKQYCILFLSPKSSQIERDPSPPAGEEGPSASARPWAY